MYKVLYHASAAKEIRKLDGTTQQKIREAIEQIAKNPALGKNLQGILAGKQSYRVGSYRIVYQLIHKELIVLILGCGHRRDIYESLTRRR